MDSYSLHQENQYYKKNFSRLLSVLIILLFVISMVQSPLLAVSYDQNYMVSSTPSFASHEIYGIARYSDGVLAAGAKVEVVSSYGVLSDWVNAVGEWSINVGDPGPNWPDETYFTAYAIGCCDHDGWSGSKSGIVSGTENNLGTIILSSNDPPSTPNIPSGPEHILIGMDGEYTTSSIDPNYKQTIEYRFDWDSTGDHNYSQFTTPAPSGKNVTLTHHWDEPGTYVVTSIARDNYGSKSPWSQGMEVTVHASNLQPEIPEITGIEEAVKKRNYSFTVTGSDPDYHDLYYFIDWDDGTTTSWIGPYDSGESFQITHAWQDLGTYDITVKTKDIIGEESEYQTHTLTVLGPFLSIKSVRSEQGSLIVEIENEEKVEAEYVDWNIEISGKRLFSGGHTEGIFYVIDGYETVSISSDPVFGFGLNYGITVDIMYDEEVLNWQGQALILFKFLMLR